MHRTACVDLPAFPLQLLLEQHPDWREQPVAVVDSDRPQGLIQWVNEKARASRILPGMRYAAGLSLNRDLRAAEVPREIIERGVARLSRRLRDFTPHVEPSSDEPGVFWLDATGLERLYESLRAWGSSVRQALTGLGFNATVVVGFGRFGSYGLARQKRGVIVMRLPSEEQAALRRVPLDRLGIEPKSRDALARLGVETVGRLLELPAEGIRKRYGVATHRIHRLASGELNVPLQPEKPRPPVLQRKILDYHETDAQRLMVLAESMLQPMLDELAKRGAAVSEIRVGFRFEQRGDHIESIRPAAPTLDDRQLLELMRLRLSAVRRLPDAVTELLLLAREAPADRRQLEMFAERTRRDLDAANRALARVRAELGDDSVVRPRLRDGHLPEGSFYWEKLNRLEKSRPREVLLSRLIRRIHARPIALPPRPRHEPDGWLLYGLEQGPVVKVHGPYVVSGGWWVRPVHREYHFAETRKGELLWVFYDRPRRRWYLQGRVE